MSTDVTVYIDESGPFQTAPTGLPYDPPWVLGGYLVIGSNDNQETAIRHCLAINLAKVSENSLLTSMKREAAKILTENPNLPKSLARDFSWFINFDPKTSVLHRKSLVAVLGRMCADATIDKVVSMFDIAVLSALVNCGFQAMPFMAVNFKRNAKFDFTNYAVLLCEGVGAVCQCLASLGLRREEINLRFNIARRYSPDADSENEFLHGQDLEFLRRHVSNALASGLVSLGAHELLGSESSFVDVQASARSIELGIADILCGRARRLLSENPETGKEILKGDGYELVFIEDSPQRKRIRMAMSEGDHSAAIVWLLQQTETKDSTSVRAQRSKELNAILNGSSKAESPVMMRFLIESVIDKLDRWSRKVSKDRFLSTLDVLVSGLALFRNSVASSSSHAAVMEASLFRARSYQYTWANHSGDSVMASELAAKLESSMEIARSDPNILEAIFQYQIGLTEQAINDHEFERAEKLALDHAEFVSASTSAATDSSSVQPCQPHVLRMVCVKLRAMALAEVSRMDYEMLELVQEECHKEIVSLELNHGPEAPVNDLVRLLAVESYCAEVLGDIGTLKSICSQLCEIVGERPRELPYATALLLRNAATISLISRSDKEAQLLVQKCIQDFSMQLIDAGDFKHPQEIIVREWLIWAHCHSLLASAEWDKALDLLEASAISLGQASRVLDHQAKVASAVSKFIRSEQVKCSESGQQLSRFDRNMGNGIGASEAQLLGIRSETVY